MAVISIGEGARSPDGRRLDAGELFRSWRIDRDHAARDELVRRHLSLARKLAGRYARTQEPFDDLFQVACLGLVKAIDRFDPDRGVAFSSYAVPTILGELKRHFRDKGWPVHLPRGLQELVLKVQEAEAALSSRTGCSPSVVEIAEYLSVETEQVLEALEAVAAHRAASMDEAIEAEAGEESTTRHDAVGVEEEGYGLIEVSASLASAAKRLPALDRQVLALRFRDELKQREIADRIGVSQMQVSRILRRITDQLRDNVEFS
jgi:RNA polymerase sigma-B factor